MALKRSLARMLGEVLGGEWLALLANSVRDWMCVDTVHMLGQNVRLVSVKTGLISGEFFLSLDDYDETMNVLTDWRTKEFVLRERRVFACQEFGAHKKLVISFVRVCVSESTTTEKEKMRARKLLLLSVCLTKRESDSTELATVRYMEDVSPLDEVHMAQRYMCLQWKTSGSAEKKRCREEGTR